MNDALQPVHQYRVFCGIRPTPSLHLGHYAAVISDLLRDQYVFRDTVYIGISDHHARSDWRTTGDFRDLSEVTLSTVRGLLALGIDPHYSVIYRQSDIRELFELTWWFAGIFRDTQLRRGHGFKDSEVPTAGRYLYPLISVSEVLSLRASHVAIGFGQKQLIEFACEVAKVLAKKFRTNMAPFPVPVRDDLVLVRGITSPKTDQPSAAHGMNADNNTDLPIFDEEDTVRARIDRIITQNVKYGSPLPTVGCNIIHYAKFLGGEEARDRFQRLYQSGEYGYEDAKRDLTDLFLTTFLDARRRFREITDRHIRDVLSAGATRAQAHVSGFLFDLREALRQSIH